jgi:hypothetical protein
MPIDPLTEEVFSLTKAARRLPRLRDDRPVSVTTVWRWATKGLRGKRLETAMVGGVRVTSDAALREFFASLSDRGPRAHNPARVRSRRDREVSRELDRLGL